MHILHTPLSYFSFLFPYSIILTFSYNSTIFFLMLISLVTSYLNFSWIFIIKKKKINKKKKIPLSNQNPFKLILSFKSIQLVSILVGNKPLINENSTFLKFPFSLYSYTALSYSSSHYTGAIFTASLQLKPIFFVFLIKKKFRKFIYHVRILHEKLHQMLI